MPRMARLGWLFLALGVALGASTAFVGPAAATQTSSTSIVNTTIPPPTVAPPTTAVAPTTTAAPASTAAPTTAASALESEAQPAPVVLPAAVVRAGPVRAATPVAAPAAAPRQLPATGSSTTILVAAGLGLTLLGVALVVRVRIAS